MKHLIKTLAALLTLCMCMGCAAYGSEDATVKTAAAETSADSSELFTDRDYKTDYSDYTTVTLADGASKASGGGVTIDGDTVTVTEAGTYLFTGTLTDGQIRVDVADDEKVQLVLDNASVTCGGSAALYILSGDKVFLTTAEDSENLLRSTGEYVQTDGNTVDGAIFSKSDLTMNGLSMLAVVSETGHGVVCKDDLKLTSGAYDIAAARDGLTGNDSVRIADGDITIRCGDDGIHTDDMLAILGGMIDIEAHEGLEGLSVTVSGGGITLVTDDDAINGAGDTGASITISGGVLRINSGGDSLDANGDLLVTGGEIYITGPKNAGNGIIDYDRSGTITGGTLIATGVLGMQTNFGEGSAQGSILYTLPSSQPAGSVITLTDADGSIVAEYTAEEAFQVVLISTPAVAAGKTYTLTAGTESAQLEMTSLLYGASIGMGASMEMGMGRGGRGF